MPRTARAAIGGLVYHVLNRGNELLPEAKLSRIRTSLERGRPLGDDAWTMKIAAELGLTYTINKRGRPKSKGKA